MTRKAYPTYITDAEWEILSPLVPEAKPIGRPQQVDLREINQWHFLRLAWGMHMARATAWFTAVANRL